MSVYQYPKYYTVNGKLKRKRMWYYLVEYQNEVYTNGEVYLTEKEATEAQRIHLNKLNSFI